MYCEFPERDKEVPLRGTDPMSVDQDSCPLLRSGDLEVIGTCHCQGSFDVACHNGLPSDNDMLNGIGSCGEWMDAWSWPVDCVEMVTRQFCGVGCLPIVPGVHESQAGEIAVG
jgi:hypothetical protein